jgi:hypothetical protein
MLNKPIVFYPTISGATYHILAMSITTCHIFPITSKADSCFPLSNTVAQVQINLLCPCRFNGGLFSFELWCRHCKRICGGRVVMCVKGDSAIPPRGGYRRQCGGLHLKVGYKFNIISLRFTSCLCGYVDGSLLWEY